MSEIDPRGLEVAYAAYVEMMIGPDQSFIPQRVEAAIRAYEAHKASAVPMVGKYVADCGPIPDLSGPTGAEELLANSRPSAVPGDDMGDEEDEDAPQSIHLAWGLYYKASAVPEVVGAYLPCLDEQAKRASAVPEEIAEVVEWCRRKGLGTPPDSMPNRAADLLERYARPPSSSKP